MAKKAENKTSKSSRKKAARRKKADATRTAAEASSRADIEAEASSRVEAPGEHVTQALAIGHEGEGDALAVATAAQPCAAQGPL